MGPSIWTAQSTPHIRISAWNTPRARTTPANAQQPVRQPRDIIPDILALTAPMTLAYVLLSPPLALSPSPLLSLLHILFSLQKKLNFSSLDLFDWPYLYVPSVITELRRRVLHSNRRRPRRHLLCLVHPGLGQRVCDQPGPSPRHEELCCCG